ncbi:hypothetical protein D3C76_1299490 [compost metagenome]
MGLKILEVKSAFFSLEWTIPTVPKLLNENIDVSAVSALAPPAYSVMTAKARVLGLVAIGST